MTFVNEKRRRSKNFGRIFGRIVEWTAQFAQFKNVKSINHKPENLVVAKMTAASSNQSK